MTRRTFFQSVVALGAGVALWSHYTPRATRPASAAALLTRAWNDFTKGHPYSGPITMVVGRDLYDQFHYELGPPVFAQRPMAGSARPWSQSKSLAFKSGRLRHNGRPGWDIEWIGSA